MPMTVEEAHAHFEEELMKEIKYLNEELRLTKGDEDSVECHPEWIERLTSAIRYAIRTLCVYRGVLPFGPMEQAAYKAPDKWAGVSYEEEVKKICDELGVSLPLYPEEEKR